MLPQPERLRSNREFQRVYQGGASFAEGLAVLYVLKLEDEPTRQVGFSVSKKLGNAIVRNQTKRRMREAYKACLPALPRGYQAIFVARKPAAAAEYAAIERAMRKLLVRAGLFSNVV